MSIDRGEVVDLRGHRFKENDSSGTDNSWVARNDSWVRPPGGMHPHELPFPHPTRVQDVGVTPCYGAPRDAIVSAKTGPGDSFFKPAELPPPDAMHILSTKVELRRVPPVKAGTTDDFEDDCPAIARVENGTLSLA